MSERARTALVTGGNRGLGLETCRQLARRGFRVILTSRTEREGTSAARALAAERLPVEYLRLDVADPKDIASLIERLGARQVDVLINNAGIMPPGLDAEIARRTLDVNFFGAMHVTDALLPRIDDGGNVVMVSSGLGELSAFAPPLRAKLLDPRHTREELAGLMHSFVRDVEQGRHTEAGWPSSAYRVSKAGLNALVRILARELADRHIQVNAVCPGWARTDMGGAGATRSVEKGAASIISAAISGDGATGGFFRDGSPIPW